MALASKEEYHIVLLVKYDASTTFNASILSKRMPFHTEKVKENRRRRKKIDNAGNGVNEF